MTKHIIINKQARKSILHVLFLVFLIFSSELSFGDNINHIDSLRLIEQNQKSELSAEDYFELTLYEFHRDSLFLATKYASIGISHAKEEGDYYVLGNLYNIKGYIHLGFGTLVKSIDYFSKGEQIGNEFNYPMLVISANHGLGRIYNELGQYEKAYKVLKKGLELALQDTARNNNAVFYNAMGVSLQNMGQFDSALVYLNRYLQISTSMGDSLNILYAYVNIGENYRLDSNYNRAIYFYLKAQELNKKVKNEQAEAAIYGNFANIYSAMGNYQKAVSYLRKGIDVCSNNEGLSNYLLLDYKTIIDDYAEMNYFDSSYMYLKKYIAFRDSVSERDQLRTINNLRKEYAFEESVAQSKILEQKLRNRTLILYFSIALSLLIILMSFLVYSRYKLKTRMLKEEAKALNLTIDEKNRELVTRVMNENQQEELYEEITKSLSKLRESDSPEDIKTELEAIKKKLSQTNRTKMGWESFKMHFENVHPDFFGKLLSKNSALTQNDLRLCGYMKLNLSTKDIANILNVSDRTIQTSRYRIKKKLNLPQDVNLVQYIQSL
jgi:tetratricopeptide (TPR) repeat protein/DNA-binding CsgD family transcriptional regulator